MNAEAFAPMFEAFAEAVAIKVVERLRSGDVGMVDQSSSPLGRRRHIAAVRRLAAAGLPGAAILGRRYLLSKERLEAELRGSAKVDVQALPVVDELAALRSRYAKAGAK